VVAQQGPHQRGRARSHGSPIVGRSDSRVRSQRAAGERGLGQGGLGQGGLGGGGVELVQRDVGADAEDLPGDQH
jgi:hypothetical protein